MDAFDPEIYKDVDEIDRLEARIAALEGLLRLLPPHPHKLVRDYVEILTTDREWDNYLQESVKNAALEALRVEAQSDGK